MFTLKSVSAGKGALPQDRREDRRDQLLVAVELQLLGKTPQ